MASYKYSKQFQEKAILTYIANACNLHRTALELDIPRNSLRHIVEDHPFVAKVNRFKKAKFSKDCWELIFKCLRSARTKIKDADLKTLTKLIGTLYEKQALAMCEPTSRTETVKSEISAETEKLVGDFEGDPDSVKNIKGKKTIVLKSSSSN